MISFYEISKKGSLKGCLAYILNYDLEYNKLHIIDISQ